jgi:MFS family permease
VKQAVDHTASAPAAEPAGLSTTTLVALLIAAAQAPLGSTMIAVALPAISTGVMRELGLVTSVLVTSYLIVSIVGQSPGGKLGDVVGHARTVRIGMVLQAAGSCIGALGTNLGTLVVARSMVALGGALVVPATVALLRLHVPAQRRGRAFGLVGGTMGLSAAIGPPLGGELLAHFGWRAIFLVSLPCLLLASVLGRIAPLPQPPTAADAGRRGTFAALLRDFDWLGTGLLAAGLAALVIASKAHGATRTLAFVLGVLVTSGFVFWELRARSPVLDPRLFAKRGFSAGSAIIGLQNFAMYGLLFELPSFFERLRGASARDVGHTLFAMMLAMFVTSAFGGRLTDRLGARRAGLLAIAPNLTSMWLMRDIGSFMRPADALPALICLGIGIGLSSAPAQTAAQMSVSSERSGMAAGATSTLRYLGGVCSVLMIGALLGGQEGLTSVSAHLTAIDAYTCALLLAAAASFALPGKQAATSA